MSQKTSFSTSFSTSKLHTTFNTTILSSLITLFITSIINIVYHSSLKILPNCKYCISNLTKSMLMKQDALQRVRKSFFLHQMQIIYKDFVCRVWITTFMCLLLSGLVSTHTTLPIKVNSKAVRPMSSCSSTKCYQTLRARPHVEFLTVF